MYIIKNLPVLLSLVACVIITVAGINSNIDYKELSFKIIISIVVFYLFGMFIRNILLRFLVNALEISEKKARLLREREAAKEMSHSFNAAAMNYQKIYNDSSDEDEEELEPYAPQKY